jgi:hypothetical protein
MTYIIGVDPGLSGAIVCLDQTGAVLCSERMPTVGTSNAREYNLRGIFDLVRALGPEPIYLEAFASFGLGTAQTQSLVRCVTAFECAAMAYGKRINVVKPQAWQKVMFEGTLKDMKPKARAMLVGERIFGAANAKFSEGERDAALIAEYGRRQECRASPVPSRRTI